jgi:hypothetical protein
MATTNKFALGPAPLPMHQQIWRMKALYPQFSSTWSCGSIQWVGTVQPTDLAEKYKIRVTYRLSSTPDVHVVTPALESRSATEVIPHLYEGKRLCLFLPRSFEWAATDYIADTTVPWATLWLHYYELWHATGKWLGGGQHPPKGRLR